MKTPTKARAADEAYAVYAAMQREEAKHPELARNPYWRTDKIAAQSRFRSLLERA